MPNIHAGHRERLKNKFLRLGAEGLEEHELLELLLFYAIPQKNTNPIAHDLINRFGSLAGVLSADVNELTEVSGIGTHAATLIKLQASMAKVYYTHRPKKVRFRNLGEAAKIIVNELFEHKNEVFYVYALDINLNLLERRLMAEGNIEKIPVDLRKLAEFALESHVAYLILAHNHPNGSARPSYADIELTRRIVSALSPLGIGVCDHIVTSGREFYSFNKQREFHADGQEELLYAAQYSVEKNNSEEV